MSRENDHSAYENWIDPASVTPHERNAKEHTEKQIKNLVNSIRRFGWNAPVRLALIDNKIYYRTFCAFVGNSLPITLIEFQNDRIFVPYNAWG